MSLGGIQLAPLLTEIKVDIKSFKDQMNEAGVIGKAEADKISDKLSGVTRVGEKLSGVGNKLTLGLTFPLAGAGLAAGKMAVDFESSFAKVSTMLDSSVIDFDRYKNDLLDASSESKVAVEEFSEAVYGSISAGVDQTKAIQFTTDAMKLAKGGFTDGAKAVDVLTTAINGYGLTAEDATRVSDLLITTQNLGKTTVDELASSMGTVIPVANGANFAIDELSAAYAQLTKNGIATSESGTYLKGMLSELTTYGSKTDKALRELTGKGFAGLKEEGKSTTEILMNLTEYAEKSGMTLKDMFGSAEAGSAALVLMKEGGTEYNEMLVAMESSAGATQNAFEKMDATPAEKMAGAVNKLKNAGIKLGIELIPVAEKIAGAVSTLADKFAGLSDEQRENIIKWGAVALVAGPALKLIGGGITTFTKLSSVIGGVSKALGLFKAGSAIAGTAATGLGAAAGTAAGATGLGGLLAGLGTTAVAAAPAALAIAGVGVAAYGVHKTLSQEVIPTVDLFADKTSIVAKSVSDSMTGMSMTVQTETVKISEATQTAVQSYMDLDDEVSRLLYEQKAKRAVVTEEMANEISGQFQKMGELIKIAEQKQYQDRIAELTNFFNENDALTSQREAYILQNITQKHEERVIAINNAQNRIDDIYANAAAENRHRTEAEIEEVNRLQEQMRDNAINTLSQTEEEAAVIRARMKDYQGRLTAEMASEMISQANTARDEQIKAAEETYDNAIKQAARMREAGDITSIEYDLMIAKAKLARDEQIEAAQKAQEGIANEIRLATPGIDKEVDLQTGKIKTGYDKLKGALSGFFDWLFQKNDEAKSAVKVASTGAAIANKIKVNGSHYNGLDYVPFDGYIARLHKGERVVSAKENNASQVNNQSSDIYNFYSPKALTPAEAAREMKAARQMLLLGF